MKGEGKASAGVGQGERVEGDAARADALQPRDSCREHEERARGGSVPEGSGMVRALNFTRLSLSKEYNFKRRFSLEASGKLTGGGEQPGGRWFLAWMMGAGLHRGTDSFNCPV